MLKKYRNALIVNKPSAKTILLIKKFDWTINILKLNIIRSKKQGFYSFFKFYTC